MSITKAQAATMASADKFRTWLDSRDSPSIPPTERSPTDTGQTLTFENVRIDFPLRPYPAQVQMMRKIIQTINNSENALLESPTGSGKSLALLCAALAWRENEERLVREIQVLKQQKTEQNKQKVEPVVKFERKGIIEIEESQVIAESKVEGSISYQKESKESITVKRPLENENDPRDWSKKFRCDTEEISIKTEDSYEDFQAPAFVTNQPKMEDTAANKENLNPDLLPKFNVDPESIDKEEEERQGKLPRIYVGSRTHKQLTQLIRELKTKTRYNPYTTILGSREHLCIHPTVKKSSNKSEDCVELLDKGSCSYFHGTRKLAGDPSMHSTKRIWDIEDIVTLGKKTRGCPYYASRAIFEYAQVTFCPYNYIIDPVIRQVMGINLKDSIIIIDEAHNIEDSSRSAGSYEIDEQSLFIIHKELDFIIQSGFLIQAHTTLIYLIEAVSNWISSPEIDYNIREFDFQHRNWSGSEILEQLAVLAISPFSFQDSLQPAYQAAANHAEEVRKEKESSQYNVVDANEEISSQGVSFQHRKCLSNSSLTAIQGIFMVLGFLFKEGKNYTEDYQMVLSKKNDTYSENSGSRSRRKKKEKTIPWKFKLAFKCLNPAIIFKDMTESTRSVILTSGTLSPLNTFASELETKFEGRLEANHVIHKSQVWIGAIPRGPNRVQLKGVYANVDSFQYQDDIGEALAQIVETVPFGVLCFMSSYSTLDKLIHRWNTTGTYNRLLQKKLIVLEPKGSDKHEFEKAIGKFYRQIDQVEQDEDHMDEEGRNGALFFAVFRGKVSEGIDFPDNYCRAVVTIGIPYPSVKDIDVRFKKEYNDEKKKKEQNPDALSGGAWYSAQAFRAINQALGRCIRHKNDWGAIIMLEDRFGQGRMVQGLSKWVRNQYQEYPQFPSAIASIQDFVSAQLERTAAAQSSNENAIVKTEASTAEATTALEEAAITKLLKMKEEVEQEISLLHNSETHAESAVSKRKSESEDLISAPAISPFNFVAPLPKSISPFFGNKIPPPKDPPVNDDLIKTEPLIKVEEEQAIHEDEAFNGVYVACTSCDKKLFTTDKTEAHFQTADVDELTLIKGNDELKYGDVSEMSEPDTWKVTDCLNGGPLDSNLLPNEVEVTLNQKDGVCYRKLSCSCSPRTLVGVVICSTVDPKMSYYNGRVYILLDKVRYIDPQQDTEQTIGHIDDHYYIPSSQMPTMNDQFYSL